MPVVKSNRPHAPVTESNFQQLPPKGANIFLTEGKKSQAFRTQLRKILPKAYADTRPVPLLSIEQMQLGRSKKPIATMEADLVNRLLTAAIVGKVIVIGADCYMQVNKVILPSIRDKSVAKTLKIAPNDVIASILFHYHEELADFINRDVGRHDSEFRKSDSYGARVFAKHHKRDAPPEGWFPATYAFGIRFLPLT